MLSSMRALQELPLEQRFTTRNGVLLFRGTIDWKDLVTEARVGKYRPWRDDEPYQVHRGFWDLYSSIRPNLLEHVQKLPVHSMCGHSLGGVFALLCANDIRRMGNVSRPHRIYTIATPRVGNRAFAKMAENEWDVYRIANEEDIVPRLPPLCHHIGRRIELNFDGGSIRANHCLQRYEEELRCKKRIPF